MTCAGEEASIVASAAGLDPADQVFTQYREQGVLLWRGFSFRDFANQARLGGGVRVRGALQAAAAERPAAGMEAVGQPRRRPPPPPATPASFPPTPTPNPQPPNPPP
jgi:hypothetical protein